MLGVGGPLADLDGLAKEQRAILIARANVAMCFTPDRFAAHLGFFIRVPGKRTSAVPTLPKLE